MVRSLLLWVGVLGLVVLGCGSSAEVAEGFEGVLIGDPSLLVRGPGATADLEIAGLEVGVRYSEFDAVLIDESVRGLVERGDGLDLFLLKESLVPAAVVVSLAAGDGDPDTVPDLQWLGSIDGRLDNAFGPDQFEVPDGVSEGDVLEVVEAGLGPLLAESAGVDVDSVDWDVVARVVTNGLQNGDGESDSGDDVEAARARWQGENGESLLLAFQLLDALDVAGRVVIPEGMSPREFMDRGEYRLSHVVVLDGDGELLIVDGGQVNANDWSRQFSDFLLGNASAEGGAG